MKTKNDRIEMLKMLISSNELGSQEEVLNALAREGFKVTQATLSRDFKNYMQELQLYHLHKHSFIGIIQIRKDYWIQWSL